MEAMYSLVANMALEPGTPATASLCHIESNIIHWIEKWLTACQQRVLLDGESSDYVPVSSRVPQGPRVLNFIKHHLSKCSTDTKTTAYLLLVQPIMEYACVAWDPHYQTKISLLEKIQRRVARWILSD